jgi:type I restriction enzyme S subunit
LPVEALLIYLRSELPQLVFKWSQDGSNHPRFDERELLRLPVPRALIENSEEYVLAIKAMIAVKQRAAQLLEAAKGAVEIAIEQSEAEALAYLHDITANQ